MIRADIVARWFVIPLALATGTACGPTQLANAPAVPTANVSGTVAAQVQATVQALSRTPNDSPTTPLPVLPTTQATPPVDLPIVLDEHFANPPQGWPDDTDGVGWHAGGAYHLAAWEHDRFMALGAPLTGALGDSVVSATFRKSGGPPGGGFGLIVRDQNPDMRDGKSQSGRFIVAEIGDNGSVGIWRREDDHWIDLVPWTPSSAVHPDDASNEIIVQTLGDDITFFANGARVAQAPMGMDNGSVGVFVGGDSNQVVLERFTVQSSASTFLTSSPSQITATPGATAASRPMPVATPVQTPIVDALLGQLDAAWGQVEWSEVLILLDRIEQIAPLGTGLPRQAIRGPLGCW
jgi:hypothetical protein